MGGGGVSAPKPVTLQQSINDVTNSAGSVFKTESTYQPQYQGLSQLLSGQNMQNFGAQMGNYVTPAAGNLAQQQYIAQQALYNQYAPGAAAATERANPLLGQQVNASNSLINQGQINNAAGNRMAGQGAMDTQLAMNGNNVIGSNPMLQGLNQMVGSELMQGGNVTNQEMNQVDQSTGSAFAQNGLFNSGSAAGADLLNRDQFSQNRLQQWMGIGNQVQGLNAQTQSNLMTGGQNLMSSGNQLAGISGMQQNFGIGNLAGASGQLQSGINQLVNPGQMNANTQALASAFNPGGVTPQLVPQLLGTAANLNQANSQGQFAASSANAQMQNSQNAATAQLATTAAVSSATIAASFA